ncbi:MAG: SET domain-containing protein [Acidobacteriota bacterium]|nr:SET domain-containing protein [Acidobacteriota bacterium]
MNKKSEGLVVKRTATGLGLFTLQPIPFDKRVVEYTGPILTAEEADQRRGKYFFELDRKRSIDGSSRQNIARYLNHSCRPNARGYTSGNRIWIWSLREIKAGEQITIDYGKAYSDDHIQPVGCKCEECCAQQKP